MYIKFYTEQSSRWSLIVYFWNGLKKTLIKSCVSVTVSFTIFIQMESKTDRFSLPVGGVSKSCILLHGIK